MTCHHVTIGGVPAIVCTRGPQRRRCQEPGCDAVATKQCDFPLARVRYQRVSKSKTCDRWLCAHHAVSVGRDRDYCPHHPRPSAAQGELLDG